ncbi:MAG: mannose-1-phosphate guanylyltransferase/mannose-6-phosphate isomerase [Treponema sp.]|nr:mannose-1-phosphate guanylyltransferase/mannose-6-phosphate isomerase [Treponema sp.]
MTIVPVILSGGSGTRLWPLSVSDKPKQFLPLVTENSMIQETVLRMNGIDVAGTIVICGEGHRFIVGEQLSKVCSKKPSVMLEPCAKNTAPAIAAGAFQALKYGPDAVMVVLPSDHVIRNVESFQKAVVKAAEEALRGSLVTFGIVPTMPHTGYGYIKCGQEQDGVYGLDKFVEKPDLETARKYLSEGTYSWNSGMFVFKAQTFLDELKLHEGEMYSLVEKAYENAAVDSDFIRINGEYFSQIKGNSIDYAVMEKTTRGKVIKLDAGWDDVGSWSALWEISPKDEKGNAVKNSAGNSKAVLINSENSYFNTKKIVAAIGTRNLVVVESDDAILIADMDSVQDVKKAAEAVKDLK